MNIKKCIELWGLLEDAGECVDERAKKCNHTHDKLSVELLQKSK